MRTDRSTISTDGTERTTQRWTTVSVSKKISRNKKLSCRRDRATASVVEILKCSLKLFKIIANDTI